VTQLTNRQSSPASTCNQHAPLNENHVRRILATFSYVDDLLKRIETLAHPEPSPFTQERRDLTEEEGRLLVSFVATARLRMIAALDRLGIPRPKQSLSARRSVSTALLFSDISLSELDARSLRGYGALDPAAGEEVTAVAADLRSLVRHGMALLKEQEEGGLVEQVGALTGPVGEILQELLRISTNHGLTEIRPLVAAAAERAAATTLDVGVFGRVGSGKSSLINALVSEPVLPVGVTSVTAVPVRIGCGPRRVEVRFRDGKAQQVALEELPTYATEERNPQNQRAVRSIEVTLPGAPDGLRLLDTPGVGSLISTGSAQAFAWLPRCDFGLVLVAAENPLGRDEIALISGLRHAGIECCVILSKVDLVDEADQQRAQAYIAGALTPLLGPHDRIEVRAVSIRPENSSGLDRLASQLLSPLADNHVKRATEALGARLRRLVAVTAASLEGRAPAAHTPAIEFEKQRGAAAEIVRSATETLAGSARRLLAEVAQAVTTAWAQGEDGADRARVAIIGAASRGLSTVREAVDGVRALAGDAKDLDRRRLPPLFDPEFLDAIKMLPPPRLAPALLRRNRARLAVAPLLPFLDQSLLRYAARLRAWGEGALQELRPPDEEAAVPALSNTELAGLNNLMTAFASPPGVAQ
jgi:GTP-binding protein EngB required for normal cell division